MAVLGGVISSATLWGARLFELVPDEGVWSHAPHLGFGVTGMGLATAYFAKRKPSLDTFIISSGLLVTQALNGMVELTQAYTIGGDEYGPMELITTNLHETVADAIYAILGCLAAAIVMTGNGIVNRYHS